MLEKGASSDGTARATLRHPCIWPLCEGMSKILIFLPMQPQLVSLVFCRKQLPSPFLPSAGSWMRGSSLLGLGLQRTADRGHWEGKDTTAVLALSQWAFGGYRKLSSLQLSPSTASVRWPIKGGHQARFSTQFKSPAHHWRFFFFFFFQPR